MTEIEKLTAGHPDTQSADIVAGNIEALRALFPEAFTEGKIDFEVLKQCLGGAVEEREEKYGLNWHGKRRARQIALTPSTGTLLPCPEDSVDWDTTQNLMIEGDNLEVLKLLQKSYAGKVKLIYIDPPYNTGKDFVYADDFRDTLGAYLRQTGQVGSEGSKVSSNTDTSGRYHTNWINMIYPRLKVARTLLNENGVIVVSIDDVEVDNLRKVLDEVYGEENFLGCVVVHTATDNNPTQVSTLHEYMLVYAKSIGSVGKWSRPSENAKKIKDKYLELKDRLGADVHKIQAELRAWIRQNESELEGVGHYDNVDERGVFHDGDIANTKFGGYQVKLAHPKTGKFCKIPEKGFRFPEDTLRQMVRDGDIMFGEDETTLIKPKIRIENAKELLRSIIYEDGRGSTKRLDSIMERGVFDNPKSDNIVSRLVELTTGKDDVIMDFFAGSGTTGHATWLASARDKLNRRFVLVQLPQEVHEDTKEEAVAARFLKKLHRQLNLAELTKERLRRSAAKVAEDFPAAQLDFGFRVYRLAPSNVRAWNPEPTDLAGTLLAHAEHLVPGRTEADILTELLLKLGLDLCVPIETKNIAGKSVHSVGAGALIVCLSDGITRETVEGLAQGIIAWWQALAPAGDTRVVFKDSAFADDVTKTNMAAILNQAGIKDMRSL